jgi:hypothetical protein
VPRSARSRSIGAMMVLSALALASLASPVSAAGKTRWVDDDGKTGTTSCSGTRTAYKKIQSAVTASAAGDTVKVCPGTYVGSVTIKGSRNGLVLRSVSNLGATIKAVDEFDAGATPLVTINDVDDVTLKGFKIRALQPDSHSYCGPSTGVKAIHAKSVSITNNDIRPSGSGGFCGVYDGILATSGTTGTIAHNVIKDYRNNGILLDGSATKLTVDDNSVTFAFLNWSSATADSGILLDNGANGTVTGNTINGPAAGGGNPSQPAAGIKLDGIGTGTSVRYNAIARFASDINVQHANGGTIRNNTMTGGQVSLNLLDGDGMSIYDNTASGATVHGLYVAGPASGVAAPDATKSTNDNVHDNDFRTNSNAALADCKGESNATAANGNTFDQNKGDTSSPVALCDYSTPVP